MRMPHTFERIARAIAHARFSIVSVGIAYIVGLLFGALMVHAGSGFALRFRDRMVTDAQQTSPILAQSQRGHRLAAAGLDASGNAAAGFLSMLAGYGVPAGYWVAVSRGWVGGVVSVDGAHQSRLQTRYGAFYYITVILLQLIPYTLAGGAGVNLGIAAFGKTAWTGYEGTRIPWLRIPVEALRDAGWIYLFAVPFFGIASLVEFTL